TLNLQILPENRTVRVFTLRSPLYARGTFKNPDVGVEKAPLAARVGAAVALGVVATPLAAILPLLNVGTNESTGCSSVAGSGDNAKGKEAGAGKNDAASSKSEPAAEKKR